MKALSYTALRKTLAKNRQKKF